jgi:ABC-type amino acid transport substrate-binding protein
VGFDIEIAKEIAKDLGVELEIKDMKFDGLLAALETGNIDFVAAGMTPTEERKKNVELPVAKAYAQQNSDLALSRIQLKTKEEGSALAVKKGNADLVKFINASIDRLIKDKAIERFVADANNIAE